MSEISFKPIVRLTRKLLGDRRARAVAGWCYRIRFWLSSPPYIRFTSSIRVDSVGIFLSGWMMDRRRQISLVELVLSDGSSIDIHDQLIWSENPDLLRKFGLLKSGLLPDFACFVSCAQLMTDIDVSALSVTLKNGKRVKRKIVETRASQDPLSAVKQVLRQVPSQSRNKRTYFDHVYGPTLSSIWALRQTADCSDEIVRYNDSIAAKSPLASIIVPIYGRYDFIEYQINQFVQDADMSRYEIIYVVDDPRITDEVKQITGSLAKLHDLAFSVVYLGKNLGYAGANNAGVRHAGSDNILLLNSDVMPATPGWLRELIDSVGESIDTTLTGVRLLYEDDTIQHDGMEFLASPFVNNLWTNVHPGKGLPSAMIASSGELVSKEAVTGACILLTKANFSAVGGFDESYILGDYEDSDLCLSARAMGLKIKVNSDVVLYHLERQSQSLVSADRWKQELTYYNCWYHTQKWDADIQLLKSRQGALTVHA